MTQEQFQQRLQHTPIATRKPLLRFRIGRLGKDLLHPAFHTCNSPPHPYHCSSSDSR